MLRALFVLATLLFSTSVFAQQPQQETQVVIVYRQMLDNTNAQLAQVIVQLQQAQARIKEIEDKCK